ncbi:MAG: flavodoxin family protein [Candidatus Paceibacterota bacterium]
MKSLIIYTSIHNGNTEKVAHTIGSVLSADVSKLGKATAEDVRKADLVGFGSGIYFSTFHKGLIKFIDELPKMDGKKVFIFSTSGLRKGSFLNRGHRHIKRRLKNKGFQVIGEFDCRGYDAFGPLSFLGGLNKGKPDKMDLKNAEKFSQKILKEQKADY